MFTRENLSAKILLKINFGPPALKETQEASGMHKYSFAVIAKNSTLSLLTLTNL